MVLQAFAFPERPWRAVGVEKGSREARNARHVVA